MKTWPTTSIQSPCNGICQLDNEHICLGCFRSLNEIAGWSKMTSNEQSAVVAALPARAQKRLSKRTHAK